MDLYLKNKFFSLKKAKNCFDFLLTYNELDVKKYDLNLSPRLFVNIDTKLFAIKEKDIDLFFVGQDKGRIEILNDVYKKCIIAGLKCTFFIVGKVNGEKIEGINYSERLNYLSVLKYIGRSRCLLNIVQPNSNGITLRDYEALNFGVYMLSNRVLEEDELYEDGQFISVDDPVFTSKVLDAVKKKSTLMPKHNKWTLDNYIESIFELIKMGPKSI